MNPIAARERAHWRRRDTCPRQDEGVAQVGSVLHGAKYRFPRYQSWCAEADAGGLRQRLRVLLPEKSRCRKATQTLHELHLHGQSVPGVLQRKLDDKGSGALEELAVEGSRGKEGASWQANARKAMRSTKVLKAETGRNCRAAGIRKPNESQNARALWKMKGDRREWRHFEWVFPNWFGFLCDATEEWLDQAASAPGELGEAVPDRRDTDKALYTSLGMACKNDALDVVKRVTHKRGFESWRKLCKKYGRRLERRCTNTRIFWSMTSEPQMDSRRDC